ncbi:uncharacterized protein LOC112086557 [Eutrema salsugineum]|uniref:uncharacterized protein LOC112086557 n=1 Tax=Eutrema salsugineum TaxID=72664 RepID=UPI000CED74CF|nr:uncharacterized protein LOC112086557 [Eutrema salsugineum]
MNVIVKVLHTWKQYQTKSGESLKIVLADEMGTKVHTTVKKNLLHCFERLMVVGEWKFIEKFSLNQASDVIGRVESVRELETIPVMNKDISKLEFNLWNAKLENVKSCVLYTRLIQIDHGFTWFALSVGKKVYKIPKREDEKFFDKTKKFYSCETCDAKVSSVSARYKLHLCVMDNTSKIKCFLFDSNAKDIVNQSADKILKRTYYEIQDPDVVSDALQNLVGKTFQFLICVEKENLYGGSNTYKVGNVWKGKQVLTITIDEVNESEDGSDQSLLMSGDQASLMNTHSQESSDDVSGNIKTPLSKRERDDPKDSVDSSSSSMKSCNSGNSVETTYVNEVIDEDTLKSDGVWCVDIKCVAFGNNAVKFEELWLTKPRDKVIICVLRFWEVGPYGDDIHIFPNDNFDPPIPEVENSRIMLDYTNDFNNVEDEYRGWVMPFYENG